jgi:N-methylhydantoinase A
MTANFRLGVDVDGTFTDVLLVDQASGRTWRAKTASTPVDQAVGVLAGSARCASTPASGSGVRCACARRT